jgi:hypothetical protein
MDNILRDYQIELSQKGADILARLNIVYYCMEVRTGKSLTALNTIALCGYKKALFLTKVKAIPSIEADYTNFGFDQRFNLTVINNESLHKVPDKDFEVVVMDEAHRFGSFPKPAKMTKNFKDRFSKLPIIFLSGTPHPESYSQIYHQFWVSNYSPFKEYTNFYKWFRGMMLVKTEFEMGFGVVANYSNNVASINKFYDFELRKISKEDPEKEDKKAEIARLRGLSLTMMELGNERVMSFIDPYFVKYTQSQAGFTSVVEEQIIYCKMLPKTIDMINRLKKKRVLEGKSEVILGDTPVKLMTKVHQMYSGTVKFESGNSMIIDDSKAQFIKQYFKGKKIAIFYKFQEELSLLYRVFGDAGLCTDLDTFNSSNRNIAFQIVSGREGISLAAADCLVYFNIDFSSLSYWQSRDRMTTMDRLKNNVYWVFTKGGIEKQIYNSVVKKKNYTSSVFMKTIK